MTYQIKLPSTYQTTCGLLGGLSLSDTSYYLIDSCALSDPFLSRISPNTSQKIQFLATIIAKFLQITENT